MTFSENWTKAGEAPDDFEPPTGQYKVKIIDGSAFTSKAGDDYAKLVLEILTSKSGEFAGQRFEHFMSFRHEVGARINREALLTYGLTNPEAIVGITDLDDAIARLFGTEADVGVSYKDGYMQIKVHGSRAPDAPSDIPSDLPAANGGGQGSFAAAAGQKADDSDTIPFAPSVI